MGGEATSSSAAERVPLRLSSKHHSSYAAVEADARKSMATGSKVMPAVMRNPFVYYSPVDTYEKFKIALLCLLGVPLLRVALLLVAVIISIVLCNVALVGYKPVDSQTGRHISIPTWRRWIAAPLPWLARSALFILGYYWIPVRYPTGSKKFTSRIIVSNHISFVDGIFLYYLFRPSIAMKAEVATIPLVGKIIQFTQPILIDRSTSQGRAHAKQEINDRILDPSQPPLLIFPEGTTSNQDYLTKFKVGSFASGEPCQPVVIQYPFKHFDVSWTPTVKTAHLVLRMLCQVYNRMEVDVLPPYFPTENEQQNPESYAEGVRQVMATKLGLQCTNHAFEDVAMLLQVGDYANQHVVPITDVSEIASVTALRGADVNKLVKYFSKHDLNQDGQISLDELQKLFPSDDPSLVEQLFELVDLDGSGQIDFRELCLGLRGLNPNANSEDDLVHFAFRLYDLDDNGVIDAAEFERMLTFGQSFYGVAPEVVNDALADVKRDGQGAISLEQFKELIERHPELLGHARSRLELLRGSLRED